MLEQKGCTKDKKWSKCLGSYSVHPYVLYLMCSAAKQISIYAIICRSMHFCCTFLIISPQAVYITGISNTVKHSTAYVEIKCQLDATEVFIADLIACSTCFGHHHAHHQELKSIIQWLLRVVFCAVKM